MSDYPMSDALARYGPAKAEAIPLDCTDLTVLDIGGYDGRFGAIALARGASRVVVLDNEEYRFYYKGTWPQPGRDPHLEYIQGDFMAWEQPFDLVLFYNVLYHCAEWEKALPKALSLAKRCFCLSTYVAEGEGWRQYEESGTGFSRATPSLSVVRESLREWVAEYEQVIDEHYIGRFRRP